MAIQTYYPEMGGAVEHNIRAFFCYRTYAVYSKSPLQVKRGMTAEGINQKGEHRYKCTPKAFDALCKVHDVSLELLLD